MKVRSIFMLVLLLVALLCCQSREQVAVDANKVLIVSVFSMSHVMSFVEFAKTLKSEQKMEVTLAAYDEMKDMIEKAQISFQSIGNRSSVPIPRKAKQLQSPDINTARTIKELYTVFRYFYEAHFKSVMDIMVSSSSSGTVTPLYDVYVIDVFNLHAIDIADKYKLNYILFQSAGYLFHENQPFIPKTFEGPSIFDMNSLKNRFVQNYLFTAQYYYHMFSELIELNRVREKLQVAPKSYLDLFSTYKKRPLISQSFFGMEYPRAISPLNVLIGPVTSLQERAQQKVRTAQEENMELYLNENKVVYVSFGSQFSISDEHLARIVMGVVAYSEVNLRLIVVCKHCSNETSTASEYLQAVLLKYLKEKPEVNEQMGSVNSIVNRVRIEKWVNQQQVLSHDNTVMFISHGGQKSVGESIFFQKAMVLIPMAMDQFGNSLRLVDAKVAVKLNRNTLEAIDVTRAIEFIQANSDKMNVQLKNLKLSMEWHGGASRGAKFVKLIAQTSGDTFLNPKLEDNWASYIVKLLVTVIALYIVRRVIGIVVK